VIFNKNRFIKSKVLTLDLNFYKIMKEWKFTTAGL